MSDLYREMHQNAEAEINRLRYKLNLLRAMFNSAERELAAERKLKDVLLREDARLKAAHVAEIAAEREQWERGIRRELSAELAEEVIAAICSGSLTADADPTVVAHDPNLIRRRAGFALAPGQHNQGNDDDGEQKPPGHTD